MQKFKLKLVHNFILHAIDLIVPARRTEEVIRALTLNDLINMATLEGPLPYHDPRVTALVWELKYRGSSHASSIAGEYLSEMLRAEIGESIGKPLLIPMPMHRERRKARGYNQTELLCEAALPHVVDSFEYAPRTLERVRNTPAQQGLARHKRLTNVKGSMHVKDPALVGGRVCVVVDDVSTTGASFAEAKRALFAAGASEVRCLPLARS